jgi:hypothetical protein
MDALLGSNELNGKGRKMELHTLVFVRFRREHCVLREVAIVLRRESLEVERTETGDDRCDDGVGHLVPANGNCEQGLGKPVGARGRLLEDLRATALEATIVRVEVLAFELSNRGDSGP